MNPYLREGNTQFDHLDLGKYLLRRILWILLFGVICGGVAWAVQKYNVKRVSSDTTDAASGAIDELKNGMIGLSGEKDRELIRKHQEYLQNAPYMQLDANHLWRARAVVRVESKSQTIPAYQIEELYRYGLDSDEYLQDLATERGTEAQYLKELVGTWTMTVADSSDSGASDVILHEEDKDSGISSELFCVQALGNAEEDAQALLEAVLEGLQELNIEYAEEYPHGIKVVSRTCSQVFDAGVRNTQTDHIVHTETLFNILLDLETKSGQWIAPALEANKKKSPMRPKKVGLIGLAAGILLACMWFTWRYLKNDKLVDYKDIRRQGLCLKELGTISEQGIAMAAANVRNYAKDRKKLFLTGMASEAEFDHTCKSLKEYLSEYEIVCDRDIVHDPNSREALVTCDAAIMVEQKNVTHYSDMKEEVNFLYDAGKEIIGIVVL